MNTDVLSILRAMMLSSRPTFLGIVPLGMPHFFTQCSPFRLILEDGHTTSGFRLVKLHLCGAGVWFHLVDGR